MSELEHIGRIVGAVAEYVAAEQKIVFVVEGNHYVWVVARTQSCLELE